MINKIGVTGSRGVVGKLIVKELTIRNIPFVEYHSDIRDADVFLEWLVEHEITSIIHLASKVAIKEVSKNVGLAYDVNVNGTVQIIKAIQNYNRAVYFFYASTSHVYKSSSFPIREDFEIEPLNTYGLTKYISEQLLGDFEKVNSNFSLCIGRIFSFYHVSQSEPYLFPTIMRRLKTENLNVPFKLMGANSIRDFLNAEDVCKAIIDLTLLKETGIINIGSGQGVLIKDFVSSLTSAKLDFEISLTEPVSYLVADVSKLKMILKNDK